MALGSTAYVITERGNMFAITAATARNYGCKAASAATSPATTSGCMHGVGGNLTILDTASGSKLGTIGVGQLDMPLLNVETDRIILASTTGLVQCFRESRLPFPVAHFRDEAAKAMPPVKTPTTQPAEGAHRPCRCRCPWAAIRSAPIHLARPSRRPPPRPLRRRCADPFGTPAAPRLRPRRPLRRPIRSANLPMPIAYQLEPELAADEFVAVLERSTLAERRPVHDRATIRGMLRLADVIVTAREGGLLVGISRAITDFSYCTYLSDLAVDRAFQRQGIGRELIRRTHAAAGLNTTLILLSAPAARSYYPAHRHAAARLVLADSPAVAAGRVKRFFEERPRTLENGCKANPANGLRTAFSADRDIAVALDAALRDKNGPPAVTYSGRSERQSWSSRQTRA